MYQNINPLMVSLFSSARIFDFFDVSIMEQLRWGLVCVNSSIRGTAKPPIKRPPNPNTSHTGPPTPTDCTSSPTTSSSVKPEPGSAKSSQNGASDSPVHTRTRSASAAAAGCVAPGPVRRSSTGGLGSKQQTTPTNGRPVRVNGVLGASMRKEGPSRNGKSCSSTPVSRCAKKEAHEAQNSFMTDSITLYPSVSSLL